MDYYLKSHAQHGGGFEFFEHFKLLNYNLQMYISLDCSALPQFLHFNKWYTIPS